MATNSSLGHYDERMTMSLDVTVIDKDNNVILDTVVADNGEIVDEVFEDVE